jgi:hypothetical protein
MRRLIAAIAAALSMLSGCGSLCIARGARVRVPLGTKPIEDLRVGDEVVCVDPKTGEHLTTRITHIRSARRECVALKFEDRELICTSDHPIYSPEDGTWAPAGDWALGRRALLAVSTGTGLVHMKVHSRRIDASIHEVFDLTVEHALHNFVANGVLVHNKTVPRCPDGCCTDGGTTNLVCAAEPAPADDRCPARGT